MTGKLAGTCGCGAVEYVATGPHRVIVNCHCDSCKKNNGSIFSTYCVIDRKYVDIVKGKEAITIYDTSNGGRKSGCERCGSPLFNEHERYPGMYMLYFGTLSDYRNLAPSFNIYCENKLPWIDTIAHIQSYQQSVQ